MNERPLVQWSFLQYKKSSKGDVAPVCCFLHSSTQIGSKILFYGGCDYYGEAVNQLVLYDTASFLWSTPGNKTDFQEDDGGKRYGHSATLLEMHPPKIMIYGGMVSGGTFEFDGPDGMDNQELSQKDQLPFMRARKRAAKSSTVEETDDSVYFLTLHADSWIWSKPLIQGSKETRPDARIEHSACKTGTNEVTIFGGWTSQPMNDLWTFNYIDLEWKATVSSGIQPRHRYRHSCELIGSRMYILGGSDNSEDEPNLSRYLGIHELNLATMQWTHPTVKGYDPFPRSGHGSCVIGAQTIAIYGGKLSNQQYLNDLVLIDLETMVGTSVNAVESHLPTPVANCSLSAIGNKCFVFGGTDIKGTCYNDIRSLDVSYYLSSDDITVGEGASSDYSFKILIIGDAAVGKSSLLTRFSENTFLQDYSSTIGIDFNSRMIRVDRAICKLEIWDTAGQERFSTITANYYRGAQGALLVYDVGVEDSFKHVQQWYDRAKQLGGEDLETVLVGNKTDIPFVERAISTEEGKALADSLQIPFVETSALNGSNVESAFVCMTARIKKSVDRRGLTGLKDKNMQSAGGVRLANKERGMGLMGKCCGG